MALKAGCDIILMPEDLPRAFDGVKEAVQAGQISESRINESVLRILKLRLKYGWLVPECCGAVACCCAGVAVEQ